MKTSIVYFAYALSFAVLLPGCQGLFDSEDDSDSGTRIEVRNASFEEPSETGLLVDTDEWVVGGDWYGRFSWPEGVQHGHHAVWSSYGHAGAENGYSQTLDTDFTPGQYRLTVWGSGDNDGLVSRLILGYLNDAGDPVELGHDDTRVFTDEESLPSNWTRQQLVVNIDETSPAIGRPIWIRFTGIAEPTGPGGGDSNSWDNVSLVYFD